MSRRSRVLAFAMLALIAARNATSQVPDWPSERPPRPLPAREIKFLRMPCARWRTACR